MRKIVPEISVYFVNGILFFIPHGESLEHGWGIECKEKTLTLSFNASFDQRGQYILKAISLAGDVKSTDSYDENEYQNKIKPILDIAGVKSKNIFNSKALHFGVTATENNFEFTPCRYEHGGFYGEVSDVIIISKNSSLEQIGKAIDEALKLCIAKGGKRLSDMIKIENKSNNVESNLEQQSESEFFGVNFGYKIRWFAIKTVDMEKVAKEFLLQNIQKSNWHDGIEKAYEKSVFISPSVEGWTFAVGYGLSEVTSDIEILRNKIIELSKTFGEVQYFESHRGANVYGWIKGIDGKIIRAYIYRDDNKLVEGEPTPVEQSYNLINTLTDDTSQPDYWDNVVHPDEEFVLKVAESWSIDPMSLETTENVAEYGLLSYMPDTTDYEELKKKIKFQEVTDWDSWVKNGS